MSTTTRLLGVVAAGAALVLSPLATTSATAAGEAIPDGTRSTCPSWSTTRTPCARSPSCARRATRTPRPTSPR